VLLAQVPVVSLKSNEDIEKLLEELSPGDQFYQMSPQKKGKSWEFGEWLRFEIFQ